MKEIELIEKRKPREKHFLRDDGTIVAKMYDNDIHYLSNGMYHEIDNTLVEQGNTLTNKSNNYKVEFEKQISKYLMKLTKDNKYLYIKLHDCNQSNIKRKSSSKLIQEISYDEVLQDVDIEYKAMPSKLKETIILKNSNYSKLDFIIETNLELKLEENQIFAIDCDKKVFMIESPYMEDSLGQRNYNVHYNITKHENHYDLDLILDNQWLTSSKVKYPVYIDPTITTNNNNSVYDTYIYSGDNTDSNNNKPYLKAGVEKVNGNNRINRTLIKFDLPTIGTGSEIIYAGLSLIAYPTYTINPPEKMATIHRITKDWNEETAKWDNMHDKYDERIESIYMGYRSEVINDAIIPGYSLYDMNITDLVKRWYKDTPNYGIMLKSTNEETYEDDDYPAFYSKNNTFTEDNNPRPTLVIAYRNYNGLESYLDYQSHSFSNGKAYVNTYNGNLTTIFNLGHTIGGKLPVNLSLVYNTNDVTLNNHTKFGNGYKLNYNQVIKKCTIEDTDYLEYNDESATLHYFRKKTTQSLDGTVEISENIYVDEDNLGLTIELNNSELTLVDQDDTKMIFNLINDNYYLKKIIDTNENYNEIFYDDENNIIKICDNHNQEVNLTYNQSSIIITSSDLTTTTLNYINNALTSLENIKGTTVMNYNEYNILSSITDVTGIKMEYEYYNEKPYRIKKVTEIGLNNKIGQFYTLDYAYNSTTLIDNNQKAMTLIYNEYGNVVSRNSLIDSENIDTAYSIAQSYGDDEVTKNRILSNSIPIKSVKNYLKNSSFEEDNDGFIVSDITGINKEITTQYKHTGNQSLKLECLKAGQSIEKTISLLKDKKYTFSGYFKTSEPISISLSYLKENNTLVKSETSIEVSDNFSRSDVTISYDQDAQTDLKIIISFPSIGITYLDDIQLEEGEVANSYNIIENADFSEGISDWIPEAISLKDGSSIDTSNIFSIVKFNNNKNTALKIHNNILQSNKLTKTIPVSGKGGDLYTISFWYKNEGIFASEPMSASEVMIYFKPVGKDAEYCILTKGKFNLNKDRWQYFSYRGRAPEDFEAIKIIFGFGRQANDFYVTNLALYKNVTSGDYNYDDNGNLVTIEDQSKNITKFTYDKKNQLIKTTTPLGQNFRYEYDNEKPNKILSAISSEGISNKIKYDSAGNPVSIKIQKRGSSSIENGKYKIRLKGTEKFIKTHITSVLLEENLCSNTVWDVEKLEENDEIYYKFKYSILPEYYLSYDNNNNIMLSNVDINNKFRLRKNDNGSYYLEAESKKMEEGGEVVRFLSAIDDKLILNSMVDDTSKYEFYIEPTSEEFIETIATYSDDNRFVKSVTDMNLKKTTYCTDNITGLVTSITDANDVSTNYTYNNKNQLSSITTGEKVVNYFYNQQNNLSKIQLGNLEYNFDYDDFLNLKSLKVNNNITLLENQYSDSNGKLISVKFGNQQSKRYEYDDFNRLEKIIDSENTYQYKYDNNNRVAKIISNNGIINAHYDIANRITKYTNGDFQINYTYDNNNNIINRTYKLMNIINSINNENNEDGVVIKSSLGDLETTYTYDSLNRLLLQNIDKKYQRKYEYLSYGNRLTGLVKKYINNDNDIYNYEYDKLNNISRIYHNNSLINQYSYDQYGQLIKEENYRESQNIEYEYDLYGNITKKTIKDQENNIVNVNIYNYNNTWRDQLTNYNNTNICYDNVGNIIKIGNNIVLNWINGHELKSYVDSKKNINLNFKYDMNGLRTSKESNGIVTNYYYEGSKLIFERTNNNVLFFIRDNEDLIGFKYNDNTYYYLKNLQDDIIGILDISGNKIVEYQYDSWGKLINIADNSLEGIGTINPIRYRSYYYDNETNLYYLNTRYYNPEWGRFISADVCIGMNNDHIGYNLYAYVSNNPINKSDPNGQGFLSWAKKTMNNIKKKAKKAINKAKKALKKVGNAIVSGAQALWNGAKKVVNTLYDWSQAINNSFVIEGEIGFGFGGKIGTGPIKGEFGASKTIGKGIEESKSYDYTATSGGIVFGSDILGKVGFGADIKHKDNGDSNPFAMPWEDEIWNDPATEKDIVLGYEIGDESFKVTGEKTPDDDKMFIGIDISGFVGIGGGIKIGFNIPV